MPVVSLSVVSSPWATTSALVPPLTEWIAGHWQFAGYAGSPPSDWGVQA